MSPSNDQDLREWSGQLSENPFLANLRQVLLEQLTGTLFVSQHNQVRSFFFVRGELRTAKSSQEDHRLGVFLKSWGHISEDQLQEALRIQADTGKPLYVIFVESGMIASAQLDAESKRLMEMIVYSTLAWSSGFFHFQSSPNPDVDPDVAFRLPAEAVLLEGIRRLPESDRFVELLGDLSQIPVLARHPASDFPLPPDAAYFLHLIGRLGEEISLSILIERAPFPRKSAAKTIYSLIYSGFLELRKSAREALPRTSEIPSSTSDPFADTTLTRRLLWGKEKSEHRKLVLDAYRRIDWTSHYDLLGVPPEAGEREIDEACRQRTGLFDPDLHTQPDLAGCKRQLEVLAARLREAYETLIDPGKRKVYDQRLREGEKSIEQAAGTGEPTVPVTPPGSSPEIRQAIALQNFQRARELIERKDYFPAIQMLEEALRLVPDSGEYRYALGLAQLKNRYWWNEGIENLKAAAKLEPQGHAILADLAAALHEHGRSRDARPYAEQALEMSPRTKTYKALKEEIDRSLEAASDATKPKGFLSRLTRSKPKDK